MRGTNIKNKILTSTKHRGGKHIMSYPIYRTIRGKKVGAIVPTDKDHNKYKGRILPSKRYIFSNWVK